MRRDRTLTTLLLAVAGLVGFSLVKPASPDPRDDARARETRFFINKANQDGVYDGVIVGDSRALRGLSPAAMSPLLGGARIFNFAFNAGGLNHEIFAEAEGLLDPGAALPFVMVVPTALAFQPQKQSNDQFHQYRGVPRDQILLYKHGNWLAQRLAAASPSVYVRRWLGVKPREYLYEVFHDDGWIATDQEPFDDYADLSTLRRSLDGSTVDSLSIEATCGKVAEWTARGIRVYGFRVPAYPPRVALEDSVLGFDPREFARRFEGAGGTWLDIPRDGYESYDGSHLVAASALRLSRLVASAIAASGGPGSSGAATR